MNISPLSKIPRLCLLTLAILLCSAPAFSASIIVQSGDKKPFSINEKETDLPFTTDKDGNRITRTPVRESPQDQQYNAPFLVFPEINLPAYPPGSGGNAGGWNNGNQGNLVQPRLYRPGK